jgi:hypothetical protein
MSNSRFPVFVETLHSFQEGGAGKVTINKNSSEFETPKIIRRAPENN